MKARNLMAGKISFARDKLAALTSIWFMSAPSDACQGMSGKGA